MYSSCCCTSPSTQAYVNGSVQVHWPCCLLQLGVVVNPGSRATHLILHPCTCLLQLLGSSPPMFLAFHMTFTL
jgi:hypothetical protein